MFRDAAKLDGQHTAVSMAAALEKYQSTEDSWFTGSPDSVDRRLAQCNKILRTAQAAIAQLGIDSDHLNTIAALRADQGALEGLRHDLLTGAADREAAEHRVEDFQGPVSVGDDAGIARNPYTGDTETGRFTGNPEGHGHWDKEDRTHFGSLSPQDRRYVELESAKFLSANTDCQDPSELAARARLHAEKQTSTFSRDRSQAVTAAFTQRVAQLVRERPAPRVASRPTSVPDFPDELFYVG